MLFRRLHSTVAHPAQFKLPPTIRQLLSSGDKEIRSTTLTGWVKSVRKQKNVIFAIINDGTNAEGLQAVVLKQEGTAPEIMKR